MINSETEPLSDNEEVEEKEEESNNDTVLPQIGEDPGLSADVIDKDSKRKDKEEKQTK
jgi:predicted nucleotide-binding protein (sugar kinase/HSP70/actin superfamily)